MANRMSVIFRQKSLNQMRCFNFVNFPYNENPMRALKSTSLKCCFVSTDSIDKREKN